jgi:hypothetical protein
MWNQITPLCAALTPLLLWCGAWALPARAQRFCAASRALAGAALLLSAGAALGQALGGGGHWTLLELGALGGVPISLSIQVDALSALVALLVSALGLLLVGYSNRYLLGDPRQRRFLRGLLTTLAAVLGLVWSGNLLLLVLCWLLTSLSLHGLLLSYPERPGAQLAARKKFLFSRLGEACLTLAALGVGRAFGSLEFDVVLDRARELALAGESLPELPWIAGLVLLAAWIKCAQFPFHGWLPEVMETPTPVSALLHAGIINAGGFLVLRLSPLLSLEPTALATLALAGGTAALFSGWVMLTQNSIKVALAWSTSAQMGFMLMQCGLGAFSTAALHLLAHSIYKAHAFLSAGSVAEELRQRGARLPRLQHPRAHGLLVLCAALTIGLSLALACGLDPLRYPGKFTLAGILGLGLGALWLEQRSPRQALPLALAAGGLAGLYFALSGVLSWMLGASVAADLPRAGTLGAGPLILLLGGFLLAAVLQPHLQALNPGKLYVWLHAGAYVNALVDRLVTGLWPLDKSSRKRRALPPAPANPAKSGLERGQDLGPSIERALGRFAPVWPLDRFVAVNPYLGYGAQPFPQAMGELERVRGARGTLPREEYRQRFENGEILRADLAQALRESGLSLTLADLERELKLPADRGDAQVWTVAEALDGQAHGPRSGLVTRELGKWCAAYFDQHQASWQMPWSRASLFAAVRAAAALDRSPELRGIPGVRAYFEQLPADPRLALQRSLEALALPSWALDDYLQRALHSVSGWVAHTQRLAFEAGLKGAQEDQGLGLLALRVAYDAALARAEPSVFQALWPAALERALAARQAGASPGLRTDLVLQRAHELSYLRGVLELWKQPRRMEPHAAPQRAHVVLCIDVRSEVLRRHLEGVSSAVSTSGFAGFFGLALDFVRAGEGVGRQHCPVLLAPKLRVVEDAPAQPRRILRENHSTWQALKSSPTGGFAQVEVLGLSYAPKLWAGSAAQAPGEPAAAPRLHSSGLDAAKGADAALAILGAMALPEPLPRLVLLLGHGGQSANNLHAAGLDCGACGGQNGATSARAAAALLNDRDVRAELERRGKPLPQEVHFVAGLHDTTTDQVTLFDRQYVPSGLQPDLLMLVDWLWEAGRRSRLERAPLLGLGALSEPERHRAIQRRARDWAEVRPEWALAGNALFIAAPRARTRGLDLAGRSFLHEYDWRRDGDFSVLELILTAPLVVASWINLQYFGSSADPQLFGSGNKVLHNAVGGQLGVLLGAGGDLMTGLPWQSVHSGSEYRHVPLRLQVFIEAPAEAIDAILARHAGVRALVDNGWLYLWRLRSEDGQPVQRLGQGQWAQPGQIRESKAEGPRRQPLTI